MKGHKEIIRLILFLTVAVAAWLCVDRVAAGMMWNVHIKSNDVSAPKLRGIAFDYEGDVMVFGTSRANTHYDSRLISDSLGCRFVNCGVDASKNIYAHYISLCLLLRHHRPSTVVLELMSGDYCRQQDPYTAIGFFTPYINLDEEVDYLFRCAGRYMPCKLSHLYRYNSKAVSNLGGLSKESSPFEEGGFLPMPALEHYPDTLEREIYKGDIDIKKMSLIDRFYSRCEREGIKVVFVFSPCYKKADSRLYMPLKAYAALHSIPVLDYHSKGLFHDRPDYFRDAMHLNERGAREYSAVFAQDLKDIVSNKW